MKAFMPGMRIFLAVTVALTLLCLGGTAQAYSITTYQTTLGSPSGIPIGNVNYPGSDVTVQGAIAAAVAGTLTSRTTFTPQEATVWGDNGRYGGELYMFSVIAGLVPDDLLEINKRVDYMFEGDPAWTPIDPVTEIYYVPVETYSYIPPAIVSPGSIYLTQLLVDITFTPTTFVTGIGLGMDLSTGVVDYNGDVVGGGSENNPPPAINDIGPWALRQTLEVRTITGGWTLTGEKSSPLGYRYGTGYSGSGLTVANLGSFENISYVSSVPEPATMLLLGLGLVGLAGLRRQFQQ